MSAALLFSACATSNQGLAAGSADGDAARSGLNCNPADRVREGAPPPTKKSGQLKVGISPTALDPYHQRLLAGVQEAVDDAGGEKMYKIDVQAPTSQAATDDQVRSVESWIAQDYDAIVVTLFNEGAFDSLIKKAAEKGIPVFSINSPQVCSPEIAADIGYDQIEGGRAQGEWLVNHYGDQDRHIAMLEGLPGPHSAARMEGFNEAIADHPNLDLVAQQPAGWTREEGQSVTENILQANPDIDTLACLYDEMCLGGLAAIRAAGKAGDIDVIGYENIIEANEAIKAGEMLATVETGAKTMGHNVIETIEAYVRNGEDVPTTVHNDVKVIDGANVDSFSLDEYRYVPLSER